MVEFSALFNVHTVVQELVNCLECLTGVRGFDTQLSGHFGTTIPGKANDLMSS